MQGACSFVKGSERDADDQSAGSKRENLRKGKDEEPCPEVLSAEERCVSSRLHDDTEETELGLAESRTCAPHERHGGHDLYPRRGPQSSGALDRARARGARQGLAGCSIPFSARCVGCGGRGRPKAESFEVWSEAAQVDF